MPSTPDYNSYTQTGNIPYQVIYEPTSSIEETWQSGDNQTVVMCSVAWDDSDAFLSAMLGNVKLYGSALSRTLPEQNPYNPSQYCMDARLVASWGNPDATGKTPPADPEYNNWPTLNSAHYRCTFRSLDYDLLTDDRVSNGQEWLRNTVADYDFAYRSIKIPGAPFKIVGSGIPLEETGVRQIGTLSLNLTWLDVPRVPYANIKACVGKVNSVANTFAGLDGLPGYDVETMLLTGWKPKKRRTADGRRTWDISYKISVMQGVDTASANLTWNRYYSKTAGTFVDVTSDGTTGGRKPYLSADFSNLFSLTGG